MRNMHGHTTLKYFVFFSDFIPNTNKSIGQISVKLSYVTFHGVGTAQRVVTLLQQKNKSLYYLQHTDSISEGWPGAL